MEQMHQQLNRHIILKSVIVVVLFLILQIVAGAVLMPLMAMTMGENSGNSMMMLMAASYLPGIIVFGIWFIKTNEVKELYPQRGDFGFTNLLLMIIGLWVFNVIGSGIVSVLGVNQFSADYADFFSQVGKSSLMLQILVVGVMGPVGEELVFRGIIFKDFRKRYGFWPGAIISAIIFSAIHMDIFQSIAVLPLGFFLAYVYEKFGKLFFPILVHSINNIIATLATYMLLKYSEQTDLATELMGTEETGTLGAVVSLIVGSALAYLICLGIRKSKYTSGKGLTRRLMQEAQIGKVNN